MIQRAYDLIPEVAAKELLRLARIEREWVDFVMVNPEKEVYRAATKHDTWFEKLVKSGQDFFSMHALSIWLVDGPKIFRPTKAQCEAMEHVEVNLTIDDYAQPYPSLLVEFPDARYAPFSSVLVTRTQHLLSGCLNTREAKHDIITTIHGNRTTIEHCLCRFDSDIAATHAKIGALALRVAINSCLALVNFGSHKEFLLKKQAESDRRLAQEKSERGTKARERLKTAVSVVSFSQDVILHNTESTSAGEWEDSGREMTSHWRKGHWRRQHFGAKNANVKRIFIKPVLVRGDKFVGDVADTMTTYHT